MPMLATSVPALETPRTLRHAPEFAEMAEIIKARLRGRCAAFFAHPGNLGDSLILSGALAFLEANGISHRLYSSTRLRELHARHFKLAYVKNRALDLVSGGRYRKYDLLLRNIAREHEVAILCGGGGFFRKTRVAMYVQELCSEHFREAIVLPTTYALAPRQRDNTLFFARDRFESLSYAPGAQFCHDMAFFLQPETVAPRRRVGFHIRTDVESAGTLPRPPGNNDISAGGREYEPPQRMFEAAGQSEIVVTDRLHVGIAAAMLGRRVYLFRGNYFKIEAIYRSSLAPFFPNVTLLDRWDELPVDVRP